VQQSLARRSPETLQYLGVIIELKKVCFVEIPFFNPARSNGNPERLSGK